MSLDAIGIISSDLSRSIDFYKNFELEFRQEGGPDHFEAKMNSGLRIMLDSTDLIKKLNPDWEKPSGGSGIVLCFKKNTSNEVDDLFKKAVSADGAKALKEPWDAFWGQRYASVLDPDGYQVDIFCDL